MWNDFLDSVINLYAYVIAGLILLLKGLVWLLLWLLPWVALFLGLCLVGIIAWAGVMTWLHSYQHQRLLRRNGRYADCYYWLLTVVECGKNLPQLWAEAKAYIRDFRGAELKRLNRFEKPQDKNN